MKLLSFPHHPESHSYRWTELEAKTILDYGKRRYEQAIVDAIEKCEGDRICGNRGFAGPTCCILKKGHDGVHVYGTPALLKDTYISAIKELLNELS